LNRWADRSRIESTLLNPALLAVIMAEAAREYELHARPMSWPLAFLVPPLVLHRPTRDALPRDTRTHLATWISRRPVLRAGFPDRAAAMAPLVREAVRFGLRHGLLSASAGHIRAVATLRPAAGELHTLIASAGLVGRWLAKSDQPSTVFALFGVRP
jgi:hypothetical protein